VSILDKSGLIYFYTKLKGKFAPLSHTHDDRYFTENEINTKISTLNTAISGKAASSHTHDDRYYTESEIDTKVSTLNTAISGKAASSHTHTKSQITDFPKSMPASDVYAWAKASAKPSYTYSEVGAAAASHSHSEYASSSHEHVTYKTANGSSWVSSIGGTVSYTIPSVALGETLYLAYTYTNTRESCQWYFNAKTPSGGSMYHIGLSNGANLAYANRFVAANTSLGSIDCGTTQTFTFYIVCTRIA